MDCVDDGVLNFDFCIVVLWVGVVMLKIGFLINVEYDFFYVYEVDFVVFCFVLCEWWVDIDLLLLDVVWYVVVCGVWVMSVCSGLFIFVVVGVFDGWWVIIYWMYVYVMVDMYF